MFPEREDSNTCWCEKADVTSEERSGNTVAKRVLTDHLTNLRMKFCDENTDITRACITDSIHKNQTQEHSTPSSDLEIPVLVLSKRGHDTVCCEVSTHQCHTQPRRGN